MKTKKAGFATRAIHVGQEPDQLTGAVAPPIFATSTYVQEEIGKHKGYEYARVSKPTRERLEQDPAALEGGSGAKVFGRGMGGINEMVTIREAGDHVVFGNSVER